MTVMRFVVVHSIELLQFNYIIDLAWPVFQGGRPALLGFFSQSSETNHTVFVDDV